MDLMVERQDVAGRYAAILTYDGVENSPELLIPPHWYKVNPTMTPRALKFSNHEADTVSQHHDESITVLEGRLALTAEEKTTIVFAGDPAVFIPRRHVHSFRGFKGERTTFREVNEPPGIYKAL